jgi:hypothetical protein
MSDPREQATTASAGTGPTGTTAGGFRHGALVAYRWTLTLFLVDVALQFFFAGFGVFGAGFGAHIVNSIVVAALSLVVLVLAAIARVGTRDIVLALVMFLLAAFGQSVFRALADHGAFWGGMHALDGLVILGIGGFLQGSAIRRIRSASAA